MFLVFVCISSLFRNANIDTFDTILVHFFDFDYDVIFCENGFVFFWKVVEKLEAIAANGIVVI